MIADYCGIRPFTDSELQQWKRTLEERSAWLRSQGIAYLLVIVPDKHTIYPENLPAVIHRIKNRTRLDQLMQCMQDDPNVDILDLRHILIAAKAEHQVYEQTGTHWNDYGAYIAYTAIMKRLEKHFSSLKPIPESEFKIFITETKGCDLMGRLGIHDRFSEKIIIFQPLEGRKAIDRTDFTIPTSQQAYVELTIKKFIVKETGEQGLPVAVVFHDSFTRNYLDPFLSEHFSRIFYSWQTEFSPDIIQREKPDIVIQEMVERVLLTVKPRNDPEVSKALGLTVQQSAGTRAVDKQS
jgi:hypothetical protein